MREVLRWLRQEYRDSTELGVALRMLGWVVAGSLYLVIATKILAARGLDHGNGVLAAVLLPALAMLVVGVIGALRAPRP